MNGLRARQLNSALTDDELSVFCWQLSRLCRAGISWHDSAALLLEDSSTPRVRATLERLAPLLADGRPLSQALEETGQFPPYFLRMVEIGQVSGRADQVLEALADYYKRAAVTATSLRHAVTYPAIMATLIALVFLILVVQVLPIFSRVFAQLGVSLSPMAATLLQIGFAGKYIAGGLALVLLLTAVILLVFFRRSGGNGLFGRGATALAVARGRFASAMALMLQSGLPLDEAIDRAHALLVGSPLQSAVALCREKMRAGTSFPKAAEEAGIFVGMQAGLLSAGFRTGNSEAAMAELAQRCQSEGENRLAKLLGRFEYSLVIVLCTAVGLVLLSVMLPLLGVLSAIGG